MRALVLWCPDWPVAAAGHSATGAPAAVFRANRVIACNAQARAAGIRRDMRRRDAQARCPEVAVVPDNPSRDRRAFEPVLAVIEALRPGVMMMRPGLLALRSPGAYYGSEDNAAAVVAEAVVGLGIPDVRIGVADEVFTAEQAARRARRQEWNIIAPGDSAAFLRQLPIISLSTGLSDDLVDLLQRMGLRTLGDFAALPAADVATRFGSEAARIHRLASGADDRGVAGRQPPPELTSEAMFEPPLGNVETICFSIRRKAEAFVAAVGAQGMVCTAVRIEAEADDPGRTLLSERSWAHSRWFTAADLVDRVHWQLSATPEGVMLGAPVGAIRFVPETLEPAGDHADALFGGGASDLVDRGVAKVQAMLGYEAVAVAVRQGGRAPAERQKLVPFGEKPTELRRLDLPWPGHIPGPQPTRVFAEPWPASVVAANGQPVTLTSRGVLTGSPARVHTGDPHGWVTLETWAGPWPTDRGELSGRIQAVAVDGRAWLMRCTEDRWWIEAVYE